MLVSLQALRALAAWLVVFHHFMQVFFDFRADSLGGHLLSTRGQVGVDIFFVLSGFVIHLSSAGRRIPTLTFLVHRLARVAPAYWLYTAITALIIFAFSNVMPIYGVALPQLMLSLAFLPSQNPGGFGFYPILPVGWTLNFEMLFYLLFALSFLVNERWRLGLVSVLVLLTSLVLAKEPYISNFYRNPIIVEFLLGLGLAEVYRRGWLRLPTPLALGLALLATLCILRYPAEPSWRLLTWGVPSAVLVAACVALEPWFAGRRLLKSLGDWSYSVYLLHVIVLWLGSYWLHARLGLDPYQTLAVCLPVILLLSWLSFEWIEVRMGRGLKHAYARLGERRGAAGLAE
ncbi:MAG: hypothetical protein GAK43_02465 [Stenotrophomonas maltophilia]|nr:MAG: hypothetical protein GAK43_02465 [Stenotrophomonas maltophilia]